VLPGTVTERRDITDPTPPTTGMLGRAGGGGQNLPLLILRRL